MFGTKKSPLARRLSETTPPTITNYVETNRNSEHCLGGTTALMIMMGAGHFVTKTTPRMPAELRKADREVLAFEALAFFAYALRETFSPLSRTQDDLIGNQFAMANAVCTSIVSQETGWAVDALFDNRLFAYFGCREGMLDKKGQRSTLDIFCNQ